MATGRDSNQVRSHAKCLLHHMMKTKSIPQGRVLELEKTVKEFYNVDNITQELLEVASRQVQTRKAKKNCSGSHGETVVMAIQQQEGCRGLVQFERRWRQHFVDSMQPKYLPELWFVDYIHEKVAEKMKDEKGMFSV